MNTDDLITSATMLVVVLGVMTVIVIAVHVLSKIAQWQEGKSAPNPEPEPEVADGISTEIIAVLAAAAMETLGKPVMIHKVRLHRDVDRPAWSNAGRIDIMLSHRVRPRR